MEEAKRIEHDLTDQLKENEVAFLEREYEIISLRKELEKTTNTRLKLGKSTSVLDDIIKQ